MSDGRDTRWIEHRVNRRRQLVEHALRAIRQDGPGIGMDEIAARAGTSKTVIYRHFGDRAGLYRAVVANVHDFIRTDLQAALEFTDAADPGRLAHELADAYLSLVERDPEIYRFVLTADATIDALGGLPELIGDQVGAAIAEHLGRTGQDPSAAITWGHGLVGFIRAAADNWMATGRRESRQDVVARIDAFIGPALSLGLSAAPHLQEQP